jgi:5-methylcytosine-specific restriction endonuclease McrA
LPGELSDADLLAATRRLVGRSNQLLASLLAHLGEVEARGIHRTRACSGLYAYCIFELRLSEDEAYRRVAASRLVRRFPALLDAVASGELHLTGLLMLGPHLTRENLLEVLGRAKHRTKKEITRLVRELDPLPDVAPRIEPLGPASSGLVPKTPTWAEFVGSMCPVRELAPGERPRDWVEDTTGAESVTECEARVETEVAEVPALPEEPIEAAPARLSPQRYGVQFTASEEYVKLVEEAQALLSHATPRATLDELHLRAMRALVAELKRRKYAVTERPRKESAETPSLAAPIAETPETREVAPAREVAPMSPRQRGRYVPAAVRRAVFQRDGERCTYTDALGQRCRETHGIELHHVTAFAQGGDHTESNLTLRCRAHNALAAEEDFGRDFIELARGSNDDEPSL